MGWDERIRSLLAATPPLVRVLLGTAQAASELAILDTKIEQHRQARTAPTEVADVMIDHAGKPIQLASRGDSLARPMQATLGQLGFQAGALQLPQEAERMTLAAKVCRDGAIPWGMIGQAGNSSSQIQRDQLRANLLNKVYSAQMTELLLAAITSGNDSFSTSKWLEQVTRANSAESMRNPGVDVAPSRNGDYSKSADCSLGFGIDLRALLKQRSEPIFQIVLTQEDETSDQAQRSNPADYLLAAGTIKPEDRNTVAGLEDVDRNGLWHRFIAAATDRHGNWVDGNRGRQPSSQRVSSVLRDARTSEAVQTINAGADSTSNSRETIPVEALTASNSETKMPNRPETSDSRQQFGPPGSVWQNREELRAEAGRPILDQAPPAGTRMRHLGLTGMEGNSHLAPERLFGIFESPGGAMSGSGGQRIDADRMIRAMEMLTRGLEQLTNMGRLPTLGAERSQVAPIPPALPAKPTPFLSRTDSSAASF
jgi:hypothetical protein